MKWSKSARTADFATSPFEEAENNFTEKTNKKKTVRQPNFKFSNSSTAKFCELIWLSK